VNAAPSAAAPAVALAQAAKAPQALPSASVSLTFDVKAIDCAPIEPPDSVNVLTVCSMSACTSRPPAANPRLPLRPMPSASARECEVPVNSAACPLAVTDAACPR
jgi:hypothetical protein